jgi:hypothetical protein
MHVAPYTVYEALSIAAFLTLTVIGPRAFRSRTYTRFIVCLVIVVVAVANSASLLRVDASTCLELTALVAAGAVLVTLAFVVARAPARRRWLTESQTDPIVLAAPFDGTWSVVVGGPDPANHHLIASDQRFACDLMRRDALSFGSRILAPVSGRVVAAHDGIADWPPSFRVREHDAPLGNHVAIDTGRGVVFLCHLQNGSVCVRAGDDVRIGTEVGRCGNSGRTSRPHLHVHAQDLAVYAFDRAAGIPIAFRDGAARITPLPWKKLRAAASISGR